MKKDKGKMEKIIRVYIWIGVLVMVFFLCFYVVHLVHGSPGVAVAIGILVFLAVSRGLMGKKKKETQGKKEE